MVEQDATQVGGDHKLKAVRSLNLCITTINTTLLVTATTMMTVEIVPRLTRTS